MSSPASQSMAIDGTAGMRNDAGPSSPSRSRTARLMAAYDAQHHNDKRAYYEVPASHFLARPAEVTASEQGLPAEQSDVRQGQPSISSSSHLRSRQQGLDRRRGSLATEARSETSISLGERDVGSALPVHPLHGFAADRSHDVPAATPSPAVVGGQKQRHPTMPDTTTLAAADYDIDVRSGFLPPEPPVTRLEGIEEDVWETTLDHARAIPLRIGGGGPGVSEQARQEARRWRADVRNMLVLHPSPQLVADIRYARRAHLVLSFLAHFYMHSQPEPAAARDALAAKQQGWFSKWRMGKLSADEQTEIDEAQGVYQAIVPAAIAVPWTALSRQLDLPPILTYADTVLWNWKLRDPALGMRDDNLEMATTFTGTPSEQHFYKTSLLIEKRGVEALTWMRRTLDEAFIADQLSSRRIRHFLLRLARVITDLSKLLHDVRTECDPTVFYWGIRPWFVGSDSVVDASTGDKGWLYEGVTELDGQRQLFGGPSAGQSSLIHAIDVFLGVDHSGKVSSRGGGPNENAGFMERMQFYMPGHHRNFLTHLRNISFIDSPVSSDEKHGADDDAMSEDEDVEERPETHPLRSMLRLNDEYALLDDSHHRDVVRLREAYNVTLDALKRLRDEHMRIATLYIVSQMRTSPPAAYAKLSDALIKTRKASPTQPKKAPVVRGAASKPDVTAVAELDPNRPEQVEHEEDGSSAKGTGGTDLVSFLKYCRTNTVNALYKQ